MQKEKAKAQSEKVDKTISEIPDWCIDMKQTNLSLVACGSGISSNLNIISFKNLVIQVSKS